MTYAPPPTVSPTGEPIWPSDWSQFVPDLVSSAVIGLLVGLALYFWQKRSERRQAETLALASWAVVRSRVKVALAEEARSGPPVIPGSYSPFAAFITAVDELPVSDWSHHARSNEELALTSRILTDLPLFIEAGEDLDRAVGAAVVGLQPGLVLSPDFDYARRAVLNALDGKRGEAMNSVASALESALTGGGREKRLAELEILAQRASRDDRVLRMRKLYEEAFVRVAAPYNELRGLVRSPGPLS